MTISAQIDQDNAQNSHFLIIADSFKRNMQYKSTFCLIFPTYLFTYLRTYHCVQTMNILIVNQSIIDMLTSFLTLLTAVVEVDGTGLSPDSFWDQFVCFIWVTRVPLWSLLFTSTYGILLMTLDRFVAVIYPVWYSTRVRNVCIRIEDKIGQLVAWESALYLCAL